MPTRWLQTGWIDLHRGEDFRGWVQFLVDELERVFPTGEDAQSTESRNRLTRIWHRAVDLESAFFDTAYVPG